MSGPDPSGKPSDPAPPGAPSTPSTTASDQSPPPLTTTNVRSQGLLQHLMSTIKNEMTDLTYVEIITAASTDTLANIDPRNENILLALKTLSGQVRVLARTRIELDGDIAFMVGGDQNGNVTTVNSEIMAMHKQHVDAAVQNWNFF